MQSNRVAWSITLLILAIFFGTMEMTVVITALPTLGLAFPQAGDWLPWLTTASLMAAAVAMPLGGRMADDWGAKKAFLFGLVLFSLGSLLAGLVGWVLPNSFGLLVSFRFLQGFGGGAFAPVGFKFISTLFKGGRRTQLIGLAGMLGPLAAVVGPNVGGFLVERFPWQIIFLSFAIVGLCLTLLAGVCISEVATAVRKTPWDVTGIGAFSAAILGTMLALTLARRAGAAFPLTLGLLVLAGISAVLLYRLEIRHPAPFLDPALLTAQGMGVILGLSFLQGLTMYSSLFFLSFYAQTHPSIMATPTQAGALLTPAAVTQMLVAPVVGRVIPRVGYRFMVAAGMVMTAGSLLAMLGNPTSLAVLATLLSLGRAGGTMASVPLAAAGLEANVHRAGSISGLRQLSNVLGGVVGPVVLSIHFPLTRSAGGRLIPVFVLMGILLLLALPATRRMPAQEAEATIVRGER